MKKVILILIISIFIGFISALIVLNFNKNTSLTSHCKTKIDNPVWRDWPNCPIYYGQSKYLSSSSTLLIGSLFGLFLGLAIIGAKFIRNKK